MTLVIETSRLLLRIFTIQDAPLIYELNRDPAVTRYTYDPVKDLAHAQLILENTILPQYVLYNYGRWAVHIKASLEFIGWCGLKFRPERMETDLGYRFKASSWDKGYATEAAFASIKYGFETLNIQRIVGRAEPGNIASIKVLEKCGMAFTCEEVIDGHLARTYEIINPSIR